MLAVFNQSGERRLSLAGDRVLDDGGRQLAWRDDDALYSHRGSFVSWIVEGWLCGGAPLPRAVRLP